MIFTDRTIIVQKGTSSINDTIILYRGDRDIEVRFTLNEGSPFKFGSGASPNIIEKTEAAYGQLIIKTPNDLPAIFSEVAPTNNGKIVFTITAEMIDEITEVGNYTFQIRLLDESRNSRATIPEVVNGIKIREPIATEDVSTTNEVGVGTVGYALTTAGTTEDAFDSQGNYNKTTWATGDRITAAKLDKIEAGIDGVNKKVASGGTGVNNINDTTASSVTTYSGNKIENIKEELEKNKADKLTTTNIQTQINNLVLGAVGDGNNAEVIQARGTYETLNDRLNQIDVITNDYYDKKTIINEISSVKEFANYKIYCNTTYKLGAYSNDNNVISRTFKVVPGKKYILSGISGNDDQCVFYATFSSLIEDTSSNATYVDFKFIQGEQAYNAVKDYKVIIPEGVNYIVINGNSDNPAKCRETNYEYTPIFKSDITNGLVVSDNLQTITHFTKSKNNYICRVFKHCFINNLLQLESMYIGKFVNGVLTKVSDIGTSYSDVIGPISINRGDEDNWGGMWAGGTHGRAISDVEYPTAKEINLKIYCNNEEIVEDGYYYGDSKIIATNDLYFPQTIQGNDISTATKAIKETRTYNLIDKMDVDVKMEFYTNVIVTTYYGCQCLTYNMTSVIFPNNEIKSNIHGLSSNVDWTVKENKYFCSKDNMHYDVELKPYGLGNWKYNTSNQFGYLATFSKIYFILMQNQSEVAKIFDETNVISWGAIYDFYID